jgi:hypothetical protein
MKQDNSVSEAPFRPDKSVSVDRMLSVDELPFKLPVSCRANRASVPPRLFFFRMVIFPVLLFIRLPLLFAFSHRQQIGVGPRRYHLL